MSRSIDIHTHILPGLDDGAREMAQAMELLHLAWEDGTDTVVLTPHYRGRFRKNTPAQLVEAYEALCRKVRQELPDMKLYLGNEAGWERELPDKLDAGRVLPLGQTDCVLLEFDYGDPRPRILDGVLELSNRGYIPVIAHVERYDAFRKHKTLADEVLELGALLQLNADSVLGCQGLGVKSYCHWLLKRQLVHFIASDGHDSEFRPPLLGECFRRVEKKYGSDYAEALFRDNANAMLTGQWP